MKFLKGEQIGLKHKRDQCNTSNIIIYINYTCKKIFNLLLKFLTKKISFRVKGSWFHILQALYFKFFSHNL